MSTALIKFVNVQKYFGAKQVLQHLSFTVSAGEFFVLVGASGSGKTTTLRLVNELLTPTAGEIYFNDALIKTYDVRALRLQMGYVLQQIALFPNMTVAQNVALIPSLQKQNKRKLAPLVDRLLTDVDLDPQRYRDRMPNELSGGEQQRVGILRAFASQPKIVLMDEPFSALDPISRTQLQRLVRDIHQKLHSTIMFVTHDMDEALQLGDRIGVMRDGQLLQVGTPEEIVRHPADDFVRQLFQKSLSADVYDVFLSKLDVLGCLQPAAQATETPQLTETQTVRDALAALSRSPRVLLVSGRGQTSWLTREALYQFITDYRNH
ncbi:ABC transporter ATP-binding protein [Schleiferilactobacillus harbinensis]|jgi:osmoprotectant transport system ATP-binding protein|uniref:ABC transporter ATP-binding protein n=1 Tax=Schleiferilactobacillus harbinensis TaxID=304207 RepID=UPI002431DF0D|nr:ABC transporter ATP-binding protein [Schleiferilactobacillus harbinensis]MCI1688450.1 ABC transporter ATP-binding protein [Schleiferilactobacillus harbinensis]MCI1850494.1 ABC transporter ATP-binding protein [Schleiferilactobacillus harbinensis]